MLAPDTIACLASHWHHLSTGLVTRGLPPLYLPIFSLDRDQFHPTRRSPLTENSALWPWSRSYLLFCAFSSTSLPAAMFGLNRPLLPSRPRPPHRRLAVCWIWAWQACSSSPLIGQFEFGSSVNRKTTSKCEVFSLDLHQESHLFFNSLFWFCHCVKHKNGQHDSQNTQ